jgi:hypothetical protein
LRIGSTEAVIGARGIVRQVIWICATGAGAEFARVVIDVGCGLIVAGQIHRAAVNDTGTIIAPCCIIIIVGERIGAAQGPSATAFAALIEILAVAI